jgi:uncharacterized membrane protein YhhN
MPIYPLIISLVFAILDWIAVERKIKKLEYIAKPMTMVALMAWIVLSADVTGQMTWFMIGAILCLAGDIFLMIPRDMFIFGLIAFLSGHILYIFGFNSGSPVINWLGGFVIVIIAIFIAWLYPRLVKGLEARGKSELKIPVLVYSLVISLMVFSAIMTWSRPDWTEAAALSASIGAILFYASDSILAWDRFVHPLEHGRLVNMMTYHLGQLGIILGAIIYTLQ